MEGSSLLGFLQDRVTVFPVMASTTGAPSGGSGSMSGEKNQDHNQRAAMEVSPYSAQITHSEFNPLLDTYRNDRYSP